MIIAEIGLNHLGNPLLADKYLDSLLDTEVDAITFQIRENDFYENPPSPEMKNYKLSRDYYTQAIQKVQNSGKKFGIVVYETDDADFFISQQVDFFKVLSIHFQHQIIEYLLSHSDKPLLLSAGLDTPEQIQQRITALSCPERLTLIYTSFSGNTEPSQIQIMQERYHLPIAYGNHSVDLADVKRALQYSPTDILLYVRAEDTIYPDHDHAIPLSQIKAVVQKLKVMST